jgi:hypothetical protein
MAGPTSDEAYAAYTKGRVDAAKAATALLDFSGPGGAATQASMDKANALQNQAGAAALADLGYSVGANGEMVRTGAPSASYTSAQTAKTVAADASSGYTGLANAAPSSGVNMRELIERTTGKPLDSSFYTGPDAEANQALLRRVSNAMYGDIGANLDARNWNTIMASSNPLEAAEKALKDMYSDKAYLAANTDHVMKQGYLPEQADYTYQQMATRVGSTYTPTWVEGTKFAGVDPVTKQPNMDTASYLNNIKTLQGDQLTSYENNLWSKWGGNPRLNTSKGVVNTGNTGNTGNTVFTPPTTPGQITGTSNVTPGSNVGVAGTTTGTPGTSTAQTNVVDLTKTTPTGPGLITGANNLSPGVTSIANTSTGNVNSGGLISGAQQQLFTQNAQVGLPAGVTPKVGAMGFNTGGSSITPYNPFNFTGSMTGTGAQQNWYNAKTGQRYTAPAGTWTPPSADWAKA